MAATDVLTLPEARAAAELAPGDTSRDAMLALYVSGVSELLDEQFGAMVVRPVTAELDGAGESLWLPDWPVASVTSVVEDGVVLAADDFHVSTAGYGRLRRRVPGSFTRWTGGPVAVTVTYQAGRYASTEQVAARVKIAARIMLRNLTRSEGFDLVQLGEYEAGGSSFPRFAVPNAVAGLLADMRRPAVVVSG